MNLPTLGPGFVIDDAGVRVMPGAVPLLDDDALGIKPYNPSRYRPKATDGGHRKPSLRRDDPLD